MRLVGRRHRPSSSGELRLIVPPPDQFSMTAIISGAHWGLVGPIQGYLLSLSTLFCTEAEFLEECLELDYNRGQKSKWVVELPTRLIIFLLVGWSSLVAMAISSRLITKCNCIHDRGT